MPSPSEAASVRLSPRKTVHTATLFNASAPLAGRDPHKVNSQPVLVTVAARERRQLPIPSKQMAQQQLQTTKTTYGLGNAGVPSVSYSTTAMYNHIATVALRDDITTGEIAAMHPDVDPGTRPCPRPLPPAAVCKFFCTAEGPLSSLNCLHCGTEFCATCLHGAAGVMSLDPKTFVARCAACGLYPRTSTIAERPPWQGTDGTSIPGEPVRPVVGALERHKQQQLARGSDRLFMASLRVANDPNTAWRKTAAMTTPRPTSAPSTDNVFNRLTDPTRFGGTHKHRFSEDGQGRGLDGTRDDNEHTYGIMGQATILREDNLSIDAPNKPVTLEDREKRAVRQSLGYAPSPEKSYKAKRFTETEMTGVFGRVHEDAYIHTRDNGDYEAERSVRKQLGSEYGGDNGGLVRPWQSNAPVYG